MIDTHTHLHSCAAPDEELVASALEAGVSKLLTVGINLETSRLALEASEQFPGVVFAAVGVYPNEATGFGDAEVRELTSMAAHPGCYAIGESGLDYYQQGAPHADQERALRAHIELAREFDKALVIHARDADDDTIRLLSDHADGVRVILHCFAMPTRIADCLAHPDWWISFAGNLTFPRNADLREAAQRVPPERLLVETDAPFLTPLPYRGSPNTPARVVDTAQALAHERGVSYPELSQSIEAAAAAVLRW